MAAGKYIAAILAVLAFACAVVRGAIAGWFQNKQFDGDHVLTFLESTVVQIALISAVIAFATLVAVLVHCVAWNEISRRVAVAVVAIDLGLLFLSFGYGVKYLDDEPEEPVEEDRMRGIVGLTIIQFGITILLFLVLMFFKSGQAVLGRGHPSTSASAVNCSWCGKKFASGDKFCAKCGNSRGHQQDHV
eukprot:m.9979 g.9979  ORF g.9979 m.9979 type:complete len:189 (-) comp5703_c0_seq1:48-614(-)